MRDGEDRKGRKVSKENRHAAVIGRLLENQEEERYWEKVEATKNAKKRHHDARPGTTTGVNAEMPEEMNVRTLGKRPRQGSRSGATLEVRKRKKGDA
jgi:hypothetical protein